MWEVCVAMVVLHAVGHADADRRVSAAGVCCARKNVTASAARAMAAVAPGTHVVHKWTTTGSRAVCEQVAGAPTSSTRV